MTQRYRTGQKRNLTKRSVWWWSRWCCLRICLISSGKSPDFIPLWGCLLYTSGSTGIHSNGFSLVRKLYQMEDTLNTTRIEQVGKTLGELLLEPTKIYVKSILDLIGKADVKGIAHITGGGFYENIPVSYTHLAQLVIDIIKDTTGKYIHKSLGVSEPDTDWDKPSFYWCRSLCISSLLRAACRSYMILKGSKIQSMPNSFA